MEGEQYEVKGVVEDHPIERTVGDDKRTYKIKVSGITYSGFCDETGLAPCRKGDTIHCMCIDKANPMRAGSFYHNIVNGTMLIKEASTEPMPAPQPTTTNEEIALKKLDSYAQKLGEITSKEELRFNSKRTALECAVRAMDTAPVPNSPDIIKLAKELEAYLNGE